MLETMKKNPLKAVLSRFVALSDHSACIPFPRPVLLSAYVYSTQLKLSLSNRNVSKPTSETSKILRALNHQDRFPKKYAEILFAQIKNG